MNQYTILVVDDTEQILKLTRNVFELEGFNVITAEDGQCALNVLDEKKVDLVVTDILMPNVDGYILCYTIRTSEKLKDTPVIIYSATYTSSSDEVMAMEIGADKFIRKPASMKELIAAAQLLLSGTRKYLPKIPAKPKSLEATKLYNEGLVNKLERRNLELEQAKEKLEQSQSKLNEAQTIANLGNWEVDLVRKTQQWSDELFHIFGVRKDEAEPSTELFLSFMHPEDVDFVSQNVRKAFTSLTGSSFEFRFIRRDGAVRHGYSKYYFEFDKKRMPVRLYGIVQDVTERKLAEMERIKMVNDLMLRNRDLEQFAYIVSHNLRAPVANILGTINELNHPGLMKEEIEVLKQGLNESVTKLDNVVKDLNYILTVKRETHETKEIVSFSKLVEDIKVSIKNLIDKDAIEIIYDFSEVDELLTLKGYLYSIFYNLISNSIKYRQHQAPCIIKIKSSQQKGKIELLFSDNGMGIDLQKKGDQIFGLYKRFHTNIEGKGMGLFMVKVQVEALQGRINVTSEVNKGTEFKIEFEK